MNKITELRWKMFSNLMSIIAAIAICFWADSERLKKSDTLDYIELHNETIVDDIKEMREAMNVDLMSLTDELERLAALLDEATAPACD